MQPVLRTALALAALCAFVAAHGQTVGTPFPVTNTRYGSASGVPLLRTDGKDFFLFWRADGKLRTTKLDEDRDRTGHLVIDAFDTFDVAWTGKGFVALALQKNRVIVVQQLDAFARPVGLPVPVAEGAIGGRLVANGDRMLVVYEDWDVVAHAWRSNVVMLTTEGKLAGMSGVLHGQNGRTALAASGSGFLMARLTSDGRTLTEFDRDGFVTAHTLLGSVQTGSDHITLASNGTASNLLVWTESDRLLAMAVSAQATPGVPLLIEPAESGTFGAPSAAWNGEGWTIACEAPAGKTRVAHLDPAARQVLDRELSTIAGGAFSPFLAAVENRVLLARQGGGLAPAHVTRLPLAANAPRDATFSAIRQQYLATASSANGTLVVWRERSASRATLHAGVRNHDGNWSEHEIATDHLYETDGSALTEALAASDGREFVVLVDRHSGVQAIRLDESGRPRGAALPLSNRRHAAIAWSANGYGIVTGGEGRLLTPNGTMSPPVDIQSRGGPVHSLASNGSGFVLTTVEAANCPFEGECGTTGLFATRLGPDLKALEDSVILSDPAAFNATHATNVVWTGSAYVTLWRTNQGTRMASMSPLPAGRVQLRTVDVSLDGTFAPVAARIGDGELMILNSSGTVVTLDAEGTVRNRIDTGHHATTAPALAAMPGGRSAYLSSSILDAAPFHGVSRVVMAIVGAAPPPPSPPRITVSQTDTRWTVSWKTSSGTVNGYRLEYRIDDGSWLELERWFDAGESGISLRRPYAGSTVAVRTRAFNDGGASEYSNVAVPSVRRRAVR